MDDDNQQPEQTIDQLKQNLQQATDSWMRALADLENYKKQKEKENKELIEFAKEVTVAKLLPTLDSLEQALRHAPKSSDELRVSSDEFGKLYNNWLAGVNGIIVQLDKTLGELGVKKIEAIGKKFDPNFHEAVKEVIGEAEDGTIIDELQSGFILNGKVIRASQVIISKKSTEGGE